VRISGAEATLARVLHHKYHHDGRLTCADCKKAARAMRSARARVPRAKRPGEQLLLLRADQLTTDHRGRIVHIPGHRGYLRSATSQDHGSVHVVTTTGSAVYPPDAEFSIWGP
jgi:hypothetical protein